MNWETEGDSGIHYLADVEEQQQPETEAFPEHPARAVRVREPTFWFRNYIVDPAELS